MSALADFQHRFAALLLDGAPTEGVAPAVRGDARADAETRLAIYVDMYRMRLVDVLGAVYSLVRTLVGAARFDALAADYVRAHPSRQPSLRSFGDRFAEHLALLPELPPATSSLARLSWARYDLFDALDQPVLPRDRLFGLAPDALVAVPLQRIAASRLVSCEHDVEALYRALGAEEAPPPAPARKTEFLVWREGVTLYHRIPTEAERALLERIAAPTALGLVCEAFASDRPVEDAAQEAFALIGRWIADGLLVDPAPSAA